MNLKQGVNLEIDFHEQDVASVFLESTFSAPEDVVIEILVFCLHTFRMMHNLGTTHPVTKSLAQILVRICNERESFFTFLTDPSSTARLVTASGKPGRKRFRAMLEFQGGNIKSSSMKQEGFGILATGIGSYAPNSVLVLLKHLVQRRNMDVTFFEGIRAAALGCGIVCLEGKVTTTSQGPLSFYLTETAVKIMNGANLTGNESA